MLRSGTGDDGRSGNCGWSAGQTALPALVQRCSARGRRVVEVVATDDGRTMWCHGQRGVAAAMGQAVIASLHGRQVAGRCFALAARVTDGAGGKLADGIQGAANGRRNGAEQDGQQGDPQIQRSTLS